MQLRTARNLLTTVLWLGLALLAGAAAVQTETSSPKPAAPTVAWVTRAVAAPRVSFHTFDSAAARTAVSYHLYTPAAYEREPTRRFPVVYWLHGSGGGLTGIPALAAKVDAAIEAGQVPPFLLVFVNGLPMGMYVDWSDGSAPVETVVAQDLVAHVDATYRTIATREGRLLDGFSMGGYGAARLGFKFPERFRAVSIMGAGPMQPELDRAPRASPVQAGEILQRVYGGTQARFLEVSPRTLAERNAKEIAAGSLVRGVIGDADETYANNVAFHAHLESLGIPHEWRVLKGVGHDPMAVLTALGDDHWAFYRKAFGDPTEPPNQPRAAADRSRELTVDVKGTARRAILVNAPSDGTKRPAVLVLHGGMGSADDMRGKSGFDVLARENGFMAVYPEGTEFRDGMHAWNTGHLLRRQVRDADDVAFLDALIERLVAKHGADPARILMTGGSNGGMMTYVYAVQRPERLAAAAPVVASMFSFDTVPSVPLPILIINGAKDEEVPLAGGMSGNQLVRTAQSTPFKPVRDVVEFWIKANGSSPGGTTVVDGSVTTTTFAAGPGGAVTEFVVDSVGGHGWPGARARRDGPAPIASFRGAERVWAFFKDKVRAGAPTAAPPAASPTAAEVLDFPGIVDPARRASGQDGPAAARKVPITLHMPAGSGPFPVVVVSHGAGGDRDTHAGQAKDLAAHGYAVLCVEHVGSSRERLKQGGLRMMKTIEAMTHDADEVLARPRDITFALDTAAEWNRTNDRLRGRLDLQHVGVLGHSFGAYTAMVACGMRPALDWLTPTVDPGKGLGPDLRDPRVRCGVALSPQGVGEPFFVTESFAGLQVPLLGISGSKDDQQAGKPASGRRDAFALWPKGEHRFVWLGNARHNDFTSASGATGPALPSPTRDEVQPVTRAATLAFLDLHLKGDAGAAKRLTVEKMKPLLRGEIDTVEVLGR